jgi:hypothetical protein
MTMATRPFIPPFFGFHRAGGNFIKIYKPGMSLAGIVTSWEDYLAFIQAQTDAAERFHEHLHPDTASPLPHLNFKLEL